MEKSHTSQVKRAGNVVNGPLRRRRKHTILWIKNVTTRNYMRNFVAIDDK
jgi:hypothetical protein